MTGYLANFTIYTMAMIGLICFAVFVYKKITEGGFHSANTKFLGIEESLTISPRKTLHVVRAGNEKFLIASDAEHTSLISKLNTNETISNQINDLDRFRSTPVEKNIRPKKYISKDKTQTVKQNKQKLVQLEPIKVSKNQNKNSAMREMAMKINQL